MTFSWKHYISLATELCSRTDEPALRSAISRAYYGAFCYSRNYLVNKSRISSSRNDQAAIHKTVIDYFIDSEDEDENTAGEYLSNLRKKRNEADYDTNFLVYNENILKIIGNANKVVEIIDDLQS